MPRGELESLMGMLLWPTCGVRWLRPWMAACFVMCLNPHQLDCEQIEGLVRWLDAKPRVTAARSICRACAAIWHGLKYDRRVVESVPELGQGLRLRNGRAWVKFGEWGAPSIQPSLDERRVVIFFVCMATPPSQQTLLRLAR